MEEQNKLTPIAVQGKRFSIPGDAVNVATSGLPDSQRSPIRWLYNHAFEFDIPLDEMAGKLKKANGDTYDKNTLYKIFTGRHEAGLDNIVQSIQDYRKWWEKRQSITRLDFIETTLSRKIWQVCESALTFQRINFIFGSSQIGKTTAAEAYARAHNHGETIIVRMPSGGALTHFMEALAIRQKINTHLKESEMRRRIIRSFDDRMLLIVDECHQVFMGNFTNTRLRTLEFIRELYDQTRCGVVLIGTKIFSREIAHGKFKEMLEQLHLRKLIALQLPDKPSKRDLKMIAAGYKLPESTGKAVDIQTEIIRDRGLGNWCTHLQAASRIAAKQGVKISWDHVVQAYNVIRNMEAA